MDSWIAVPFMMVMLLAGLQALPIEVFEAAQIDGASGWKRFWDITFPLMLPVSLTAVVLRVIFEFKLVDVVRVVTAGGPGGATDTLSLYIYREGVESGNVGYATAIAMVFLIVVLVSVTALLIRCRPRVSETSSTRGSGETEAVMSTAEMRGYSASRAIQRQAALGRTGIYAALIVWAIICLFPLYWTVTTSIKPREAVLQGPKYVPWVDFQPDNKGWFPILYEPGQRGEFLASFRKYPGRVACRRAPGGCPGLARGVRALPLPLSIRAV